jgi:TonB family protein
VFVKRAAAGAWIGWLAWGVVNSAGAQTPSEPSAPGTASTIPDGAAAPPGTNAPSGPVVTPPQLQRFVDAPYPPEAKAAGITGDVILNLVVGADGSVKSVAVVRGAGHGFDEAAVAAAEQFVFSPALRDGVPVATRIPYKYSFTLTQEAAAIEAPSTGELGGRLLVAGVEVGLAGAEITITSASGERFGARTDENGVWSVPGLAPGAYRVVVQATGFADLDSPEEVTAGEQTELVYRISPQSEGFQVSVVGERPPREVTRRQISRREMMYVPGTRGDALRSVQNLPGLARPPGLAGLLIVRGAAPQDSSVFIDGDTVPLIYHFGGLSSAVPTELLERIDFYPGNFSSKYGRVMGGIVDVALREPDTSCDDTPEGARPTRRCTHGLVAADLIDARLVLQGPVPGTKTWSFAIGGRRSWIDAWIGPVLESAGASVTSAPVYDDLQLILETRPTKNTRISLRYLSSNDRLELVIKDPAAQDPGALGGSIRFATGFSRFQAVLESQLSKDVELKSLLSAGTDEVAFSLGRFAFNLDSTPVQARSELSWALAQGVRLNAGFDFITVPFDVLVRLPEPPRAGEPAAGPTSLRPLLESRNHDTAFRPGWYGDMQFALGPRLTVTPGFRVDYARDSGDADFSPRATLRYRLTGADGATSSERRTVIKAGAGVYSQPPQFQETDPIFGTPGTRNNRSVHYALGVERQLTQQIDINLEGFYKDLTHQVARSAQADGSFAYNNRGTGSVVGTELLLKYNSDDHFFGWLAYTLSRSVRRDGPGQPEYLFQFDQTHILTLLGSYRFGSGWEVGGRFRVISGSLDTPARAAPDLSAVFAADAAAYTPLPAQPFSERLPLFHQLDVRAEKVWTRKHYKFALFLDVWNIYNNPAQEAISYNFDYSKRTFQDGLPIIPSLGLRGEF